MVAMFYKFYISFLAHSNRGIIKAIKAKLIFNLFIIVLRFSFVQT